MLFPRGGAIDSFVSGHGFSRAERIITRNGLQPLRVPHSSFLCLGGVNTIKIVAPDVSGINFSLASSEIAALLGSRFGASLPGATLEITSTGIIAVTSTPSGADIEVDGAFFGSTPAELPLSVGERTLGITKKGYTPFERKLEVVAAGKQSISADLELLKP